MNISRAQEILDYWFPKDGSPDYDKWFMKSENYDDEIKDDIYVKLIFAYLGEGSWHKTTTPDRVLYFFPLESCFKKGKPKVAKGKITSITRINNNSLPPKIKCGANYINSRLGYLEVNYDNDQMKKIDAEPLAIILEPSRRNTARSE